MSDNARAHAEAASVHSVRGDQDKAVVQALLAVYEQLAELTATTREVHSYSRTGPR